MDVTCRTCREPIIGPHVNANSHKFHAACFVCHQCLEPFPENVFFEADGGFFCEFDYTVLHGPRCGRCGELIRGKCITAMDVKWHAEHFTCVSCGKPLVGTTFVRKNNKPHCKPCAEKIITREKQVEICERCKKPLKNNPNDYVLILDNKKFHAHHFSCVICKEPLGPDCRIHDGKLYCAADLERSTMKVCQACRRPIQGRSVTALGKQYHLEHFVCSKCEKPFNSSVYWELKGKPYCEIHYHELLGELCGLCCEPISGSTIQAMSRKWCEKHFMCMACLSPLIGQGTSGQFVEWDSKPFCKRCFEKLPAQVRNRVGKEVEREKKIAAAVKA